VKAHGPPKTFNKGRVLKVYIQDGGADGGVKFSRLLLVLAWKKMNLLQVSQATDRE